MKISWQLENPQKIAKMNNPTLNFFSQKIVILSTFPLSLMILLQQTRLGDFKLESLQLADVFFALRLLLSSSSLSLLLLLFVLSILYVFLYLKANTVHNGYIT